MVIFKYIWIHVFLFTIENVFATHFTICHKDTKYEYPIDKCPGGIQIRNVNKWFSESRKKACILGDGPLFQFDGEGDPWFEDIYPHGYPDKLKTFLGSWVDYDLNTQAQILRGKKSSALFIDGRKYKDPENFPTRSLELIVTPVVHDRLSGGYEIAIQAGLDVHPKRYTDLLKTVIINTQQAFILKNMTRDGLIRNCAYNLDEPDVILAKYASLEWDISNLEALCEKKDPSETYHRISQPCPPAQSCRNVAVSIQGQDVNGDLESYQYFLQTMAEVSVRMKYSKKHVEFIHTNNPMPFMAMLQRSCRVFYRGFPDVVKWETMMNALTIFAVSFDGLIPNNYPDKMFNQVRIALGRCGLAQEKKRAANSLIYNQTCVNQDSEKNESLTSPASQPPNTTSESQAMNNVNGDGPPLNKLIELLWKTVQFTQAACLSSIDYHTNVHHFYASAMLQVFSTPAVQLLWYQKPENTLALDRAMLHIFPELPDSVLPTMTLIINAAEYSTHFNVLQRPTIEHMESRDMRCAGHGTLIWGGKACCYLEEDDKKLKFYNRVSFAKI